MPQKIRLRVSVSLAKLPKRQREFLDKLKTIDELDVHSFYAHLITYFYFHPTKAPHLIGAVGKKENKIALSFNSKPLVETLTNDKTQAQRELYCLTALYEIANMLAYKLFMYSSHLHNQEFQSVAELENQFFEIGISPFLEEFISLTKDSSFFQNLQIMASSYDQQNSAYNLIENFIQREAEVSSGNHLNHSPSPALESDSTNVQTLKPEAQHSSPDHDSLDHEKNDSDQEANDDDWSQIQVS